MLSELIVTQWDVNKEAARIWLKVTDGINSYIVGCKLLNQLCMMQSLTELIVTQWDVNSNTFLQYFNLFPELIVTQWDVNFTSEELAQLANIELIVTQWDVNNESSLSAGLSLQN